MEHPVAGIVSDEGKLGFLAWGDEDGVAPLAIFRRLTVPRDDAE